MCLGLFLSLDREHNSLTPVSTTPIPFPIGTVEALATIENILEHIANYLKKDPLEVRMLNMVKPEVPRLMAPPLERNVVLDEILPLLKQKAMYEQRKEEVEAFNKVIWAIIWAFFHMFIV